MCAFRVPLKSCFLPPKWASSAVCLRLPAVALWLGLALGGTMTYLCVLASSRQCVLQAAARLAPGEPETQPTTICCRKRHVPTHVFLSASSLCAPRLRLACPITAGQAGGQRGGVFWEQEGKKEPGS